jgi:hypothetical protein
MLARELMRTSFLAFQSSLPEISRSVLAIFPSYGTCGKAKLPTLWIIAKLGPPFIAQRDTTWGT